MIEPVDRREVLDRLRAALVASIVSGARSNFMHPNANGLAQAIALVVHEDDYRNVREANESVMRAAMQLYADIINGIPDDHGIMPEQLFERHLPEWLRGLLYLSRQF